MAEQTFQLDGLRCQGCVDTVATALSSLSSVSAVSAVSVDLDTEVSSTVRISTGTELARAQVQAALSAHGNFTVVG
jgi:copper chaperone